MESEADGAEFLIRIDESRVPYPVLALHGDLDVFTANQLRQRLVDLMADGEVHIILDLNELGFIDSAGLAVIIGSFKRLTALEGGGLGVVCGQPAILKVFEISGLTPLIPISSNLDDALARMG